MRNNIGLAKQKVNWGTSDTVRNTVKWPAEPAFSPSQPALIKINRNH